MSDLKINELHRDYIEVFDAAENAITGLIQDDFDIVLLVNGSLSSKPITIIEVNAVSSPGVYEVTFTPDTLGGWYYHITQDTYAKAGWKDLFKCTTYDIDGIGEELSNLLDNYNLGDKGVVITVTDQDTDVPIEGAFVEIYNETLTSRVVYAYTNANGQTPATLTLYAGTYKVTAKKFGYYTFENPFTLVVVDDTTLSIEGLAFAPTPPSSPEVCGVYGWLTASGQPQQATVTARLLNDAYYLDSQQIEVVVEQSVVSRSSDGYWALPLTRTKDSMNDDIRYEFKVGDTSIGVYSIPDEDNVPLKTLADEQQDETSQSEEAIDD